MTESLIGGLTSWIEMVIGRGGYPGIVLLMAIESACIPLPSEVIMPFAGALTLERMAAAHSLGPLSLPLIALAGALGCVLGSSAAYIIGATGGRELTLRYGRYLLIRRRDLDQAELWFARRGGAAVFLARLLPVVRTFISLPAGVARMPFVPFISLTFLGSLPWCYGLAWVGVLVGGHISRIKTVFHGADAFVLIVSAILFIVWLRRHLQPDEKYEKS